MERRDLASVKTVDSIMELLTEVNIGADGVTMNYPPNNSAAYGHPDNASNSNYYLIDGGDMSECPANSENLKTKAEESPGPKAWREGMEVKTVDDGTAKTVFITQNLNKGYEEQESKCKLVSYNEGVAKIVREVDYFNMILSRVGDDLKGTEYKTSKEKVLEQRETIKGKLISLKDVIDKFIDQKLTGEVSARKLVKKIAEKRDLAEYAFLGDKKPPQGGNAEGCTILNMCTDCNIEIIAQEGQDLESAMVQHSQTEQHKASMPEPPPPRKSKTDMTNAQNPVAETGDKKAIESLKKNPILKLNRIAACLIDDSMTCEVCDLSFPCHVQDIFRHMSEQNHKEKLNTYNIEAQKTIVEKNPELFGEAGQFQLTLNHTNLHKIFVEPTIKQAYCGLCCRQLPFSQSNIDEHIASSKHEKCLIEMVESSCADFVALGIDSSILSSIKAKSTDSTEYAPKEMKLKREPQLQQHPQQQQQQQQQQHQQQQQQKDMQSFLDVSEIQNYRKVLPDKPIRSIPELYDCNNVPIHNLEHYEQPELKKFLNDNGLQRQAGGKFKCVYCPNLELPNSRYAYRHINKHKMGSGNSQCFENWKRPSNRQQGYSNEQKLGRVVMHKNGVNYWCTSCRLPLIDASTAFAHVKTDNHHVHVDGVSFSSGTIFDCSTCKTTINGEKNACQHLVAAKHRENSKMDALAKQEGRMNLIEERKQKQMEKQKVGDSQRKEKSSSEVNANMHASEEEKLLDKNGVVYYPDSGIYHCTYCGWSIRKRPDMLNHIFSFEHVATVSKQSR